MEKIYLDSEKYDEAVEAYRSKYGYDEMSDEEKEAFDMRLDKVIERKDDGGDPSKDTESIDNRSDSDKYRDEIKEKYGYDDLSDDQKRIFDERLDKLIDQETSESEDPDQSEKVLRRILDKKGG